MSARQYFLQEIEPSVLDFRSDRKKRHKISAAITSLNHFADHLADGNQTSYNRALSYLYDKCPSFKYLKAMSNALKHSKINKNQFGLGLRYQDIKGHQTGVLSVNGRPLSVGGGKVLSVEIASSVKIDGTVYSIPDEIEKAYRYIKDNIDTLEKLFP